MSDTVIKVEGVSKKYCRSIKHTMLYGVTDLTRSFLGLNQHTEKLRNGEFWAVDGVSFELKRGETLGIIGPNGSGKSTMLKLLNGIFMPDKGKIEIKGRVGALIEVGAGFHPMLTGRENIYINGAIFGMSKKEVDKKFDKILDFADIGNFIDSPVKHYSSGMLVRLGFSVAAHCEPDIMLIDEVLAVGDVGFRSKCFNAIDRIARNAAVIFVSHQMSQVSRVCTDVILMDKGIAIYKGKDVPTGIEHYYLQFESAKKSISGNGKASIHKISLYSEKDKESDSLFKIKYLDSLYIEVSFSLAPEVKSSVMYIALSDKELRGVAQCSSYNCKFTINNKKDVITTRLKIANIQLNPGIYYISIALLDETRREIFTHNHMVKEFQVIGSFIGHAPIQLNGEWGYVQ